VTAGDGAEVALPSCRWALKAANLNQATQSSVLSQ
jgi:hypothetical protein